MVMEKSWKNNCHVCANPEPTLIVAWFILVVFFNFAQQHTINIYYFLHVNSAYYYTMHPAFTLICLTCATIIQQTWVTKFMLQIEPLPVSMPPALINISA